MLQHIVINASAQKTRWLIRLPSVLGPVEAGYRGGNAFVISSVERGEYFIYAAQGGVGPHVPCSCWDCLRDEGFRGEGLEVGGLEGMPGLCGAWVLSLRAGCDQRHKQLRQTNLTALVRL
jgi:hypothetical protein